MLNSKKVEILRTYFKRIEEIANQDPVDIEAIRMQTSLAMQIIDGKQKV